MSIDNILGTVYNELTRSNKTRPAQAAEQAESTHKLWTIYGWGEKQVTNRDEDDQRVANKKERG